jgi:hypothetical protein
MNGIYVDEQSYLNYQGMQQSLTCQMRFSQPTHDNRNFGPDYAEAVQGRGNFQR